MYFSRGMRGMFRRRRCVRGSFAWSSFSNLGENVAMYPTLPRQNSVTDTETIDIADLRRIEILYTVPFCRLWLAGWR